ILLAHSDGALVGCVQVARVGDDRTYLGMLTVEPSLQASGLGRRLLAAAETEAVARFAACRMEMTVIHRRAELIAWYQRRGYRPTGETRPFPVDPPRPELEFVVLEKAL
ncbi:MAG: GNAT family N-acetyltransferase, partial [Brevundimonas sp.]